jgi:hypothetical protein
MSTAPHELLEGDVEVYPPFLDQHVSFFASFVVLLLSTSWLYWALWLVLQAAAMFVGGGVVRR